MNQLVARKDGWVIAGWRKKDPVVYSSGPILEGEIIGSSVEPMESAGVQTVSFAR